MAFQMCDSGTKKNKNKDSPAQIFGLDSAIFLFGFLRGEIMKILTRCGIKKLGSVFMATQSDKEMKTDKIS